jgi:hypothetical protein
MLRARAIALVVALAVMAGCGEETDSGGGGQGGGEAADTSPKQVELAREIGYDQCKDPLIDPKHAESDPVGYAEEQFGGPDVFDQARVEGCIEALTD